MNGEDPEDFEGPVEIPVDGILDLHAFRPSDIGTLVPDYLEACREKGILRVRLIHGKGTGSLRRGVHALLDTLDEVEHYRTADDRSGWGATLVFMKPPSS